MSRSCTNCGHSLGNGVPDSACMSEQCIRSRVVFALEKVEVMLAASQARVAGLKALVEAFVHIDYTGQEDALASVAADARAALAKPDDDTALRAIMIQAVELYDENWRGYDDPANVVDMVLTGRKEP